MSSNSASGRQILRRLAQTAMLEHGLLPDFSAAAMRETSAFKGAANPPAVGEIRDLRHLLWASIDNDDSLDLDQLSVAERARWRCGLCLGRDRGCRCAGAPRLGD